MSQLVEKLKSKTGIFLFAIISVLTISVGYAALNTDLSISGDAYVRVDEDIRITELKMIEAINGAYEIYNHQYSKDSTSMFISLPNSNSTITYEVTVVNNTAIKYQLKDIIETSFTNKNVNYEVIGLTVDEIIPKNATVKFQVRFSTSANNQETNVLLNYVFEEFHSFVLAKKDTDFTGEYNIYTKNPTSTHFKYWGSTIYFNRDLSVISISYQNNRIALFSNNKYDLTNFDTLVFEIESITNHKELSSTTYFGVMDLSSPYDDDENKFIRSETVVQVGMTKTTHIVRVDVSDLKGEYYIKMLSIHGGQTEAFSSYTAIRTIYFE